MSLYPTKRWFGGHSGYNQTVTVKEELHRLIEGLADEHARNLLDDLRDAADVNGPPLDSEARASLDRGLADISAGRVVSLEEFENKHPL
jgi:predicted transcriptional regulator